LKAGSINKSPHSLPITVFIRLLLVKIGSIHSLIMIWNTVFLNNYTYWNGMFFLAIRCIYFIETTQNYTIFWYMYCYQFVTFLTILKITAFLMICWNVFIHFHGEWSMKCTLFGIVSIKCIHIPVQNIYTSHSNKKSKYGVWKRVQLKNPRTLYLLHFTKLFCFVVEFE
jgi:hypothetical protein